MRPAPERVRRFGGWALAAVLVVLGVGLLACKGDGRTRLMLYSPHGKDLLSLVEERYEKLHPEVDVRFLDMGSQDVFDRVRSEAANPQADVWYGGPSQIFARGAREGMLTPHRPAWADAVPAASRAPGDLYFGLYRTAPVLVYNAAALPAAEAPRDWDDLLLPRFHGQVLMRDPLASGTLRTLFGMILARSVAATGDTRQGFDWLRRLDAQTKEYTLTPALMFEKLNRREGLVTVWELTDMLWQKKRGSPLAFRFATSGSPVIDDSIGLVKGAPHEAEARRFIDWVGSVDAQLLTAEHAFRLPARTDMPAERLPEWAREVLRDLVPAELDGKLLDEHSQEWMATWDREIRGHGGEPAKPAA